MFRELTEYEKMIMAFMARSDYTRGHVTALANADTSERFEEVLQRAVDRYEDWASD